MKHPDYVAQGIKKLQTHYFFQNLSGVLMLVTMVIAAFTGLPKIIICLIAIFASVFVYRLYKTGNKEVTLNFEILKKLSEKDPETVEMIKSAIKNWSTEKGIIEDDIGLDIVTGGNMSLCVKAYSIKDEKIKEYYAFNNAGFPGVKIESVLNFIKYEKPLTEDEMFEKLKASEGE